MDGVRKGLGWSVGEHELNRRVIRELLAPYLNLSKVQCEPYSVL